jgi:hypothetical protein
VISPEFTRKTTTVRLLGDGAASVVGRGEDVTYDPSEHEPGRFGAPELSGSWTIDSFASRLDELALFPMGEPDQAAYRDYRRWAFESAALDLALLQTGTSLADALGRSPAPLRFVSSSRTPAGWMALYPDLRFKLDATPAWDDAVLADLAASDRIDVVDLKGAYHGTVVDNPPDAALYRRVAEALPLALIEDPGLTPETDPALAPYRERVTWDAPIHSFADVEALPFPPRWLNSKPSRFGSLAALLEFYDRCAEAGIRLYGGGQFELGVGRDQIQILASLIHPDGPNDVAPGGYNNTEPTPGLPPSPLEIDLAPAGFRRLPV